MHYSNEIEYGMEKKTRQILAWFVEEVLFVQITLLYNFKPMFTSQEFTFQMESAVIESM